MLMIPAGQVIVSISESFFEFMLASKRHLLVNAEYGGPSSLCVILAHSGTYLRGEPQFLAIAPAGKVAVDWISLYMDVIRIGDAAEDLRFSL
jgi:hypothetical protein